MKPKSITQIIKDRGYGKLHAPGDDDTSHWYAKALTLLKGTERRVLKYDRPKGSYFA